MSDSGKKNSGNRSPTTLRLVSNIPQTDSVEILASTTGSEIPLKSNGIDIEEEENCDAGELELNEVETVGLCEEALLNLEAAAENALQLFSKLANFNIGKEKSTGIKFLSFTDQAAARLPSIASKVEAIAKLLQLPATYPIENLWSVQFDSNLLRIILSMH